MIVKHSILTVKELRKILKDYDKNDTVSLSIVSFDEEGAKAELSVNTKKKNKVIMREERSVW
jgi:hypothetical protein